MSPESDQAHQRIRLQLGQLILFAVIGLMVACAVGIYPTWKAAGSTGLAAMGGGMAIVVLAFVVGVPVLLTQARKGRQALGMGFLMSSPVRLLLTLGLALAVWKMTGWPMMVFFLWIVGCYFVLLSAEGLWLARLVKPDSDKTDIGG